MCLKFEINLKKCLFNFNDTCSSYFDTVEFWCVFWTSYGYQLLGVVQTLFNLYLITKSIKRTQAGINSRNARTTVFNA